MQTEIVKLAYKYKIRISDTQTGTDKKTTRKNGGKYKSKSKMRTNRGQALSTVNSCFKMESYQAFVKVIACIHFQSPSGF